MTRQVRSLMIELFGALALAAALSLAIPHVARAAVISTDDAMKPQAAQERSRVKALIERPDVARELQKFGVAPQDVDKRIDAMSDDEVRMLAGRIDALPAGGALSNTDFLLVVIIIILVVVLL